VLSPLQIRKGTEEYFLCSRLEDCASPLSFYDETEALFFLRSVITAVERPASKISTETTTGEPPAVEADTDVHKSPKIDTKIDHHD
jgi:hypothetical protein